MVDVTDYENYREFIRDFYQAKKAEDPRFSYQRFAADAGYGAKTSLYDIVQGKRKLSSKSVYKVADAMKLGQRDREYFKLLVSFNNAESPEDKEYHYNQLQKFLGKTASTKIGSQQYRYLAEWYHMVVRELVTSGSFNGNYQSLSKRTIPRLTKKQVEDSVALLLELGLIQKTPSGKFRQADKVLSTGDEVKSLAAVKNLQKTMELASDALYRFPARDREISSYTASMPRECFELVKKEIQVFRKKIMGLIEGFENEGKVYQINFQLFPLSEPGKKES